FKAAGSVAVAERHVVGPKEKLCYKAQLLFRKAQLQACRVIDPRVSVPPCLASIPQLQIVVAFKGANCQQPPSRQSQAAPQMEWCGHLTYVYSLHSQPQRLRHVASSGGSAIGR
ncbi:hypothetical protein VaNZ11_011188, partial [Volvox africanus]